MSLCTAPHGDKATLWRRDRPSQAWLVDPGGESVGARRWPGSTVSLGVTGDVALRVVACAELARGPGSPRSSRVSCRTHSAEYSPPSSWPSRFSCGRTSMPAIPARNTCRHGPPPRRRPDGRPPGRPFPAGGHVPRLLQRASSSTSSPRWRPRPGSPWTPRWRRRPPRCLPRPRMAIPGNGRLAVALLGQAAVTQARRITGDSSDPLTITAADLPERVELPGSAAEGPWTWAVPVRRPLTYLSSFAGRVGIPVQPPCVAAVSRRAA
jgi:hypothetical protein